MKTKTQEEVYESDIKRKQRNTHLGYILLILIPVIWYYGVMSPIAKYWSDSWGLNIKTPSIIQAVLADEKPLTDKDLCTPSYDKKAKRSHCYLNDLGKEWVLEQVSNTGLSVEEAKCIIKNESGWDAEARYVNSDSSIDRGVFELNDKWHYEVSNQCAFSVMCNTKEAIRIRLANGDWNAWSTYNKFCK